MTTLNLEQKQTLYRDGYIVLKNAVSQQLVDAALDRLRNPVEGQYAGAAKEMTDLVNASNRGTLLCPITSALRPRSPLGPEAT